MQPTEYLKIWIECNFEDYELSHEPIHGTYGLIWFLKAKKSYIHPQTRALKTLDPENIHATKKLDDIEYLKREFRMWMELPPTYNVIGGLKLDMVPIPDFRDDNEPLSKTINLPIMVMEKMTGSLKDWIGNINFKMEDRLFALAQAFNGLAYLYSQGVEGHGDLKPENLLYMDMRERFSIEEENWLYNIPWVIKVADLGWADAWVDYGYTEKAFRHYLAPERIGQSEGEPGRFIPEKSDIYSMGIIAAEMLQGKHPAKNLKKVKGSNGKWFRWAMSHDIDLSEIESARMFDLISRCLHPNYNERPSAIECLDSICQELKEVFDLNQVQHTLELWRKDISKEFGVSDEQHAADVILRCIELGGEQANILLERLEKKENKIEVTDVETCIAWATIASTLVYIYEEKFNSNVASKRAKLREDGIRYLGSVFGKFSKEQLDSLVAPSFETKFEWLATILKRLAYIASIRYDDISKSSLELSDLALSALAYSTASSLRLGAPAIKPLEYYLDEAIRLAPREATPLYFKVLWGYGSYLRNYKCEPYKEKIICWIEELENACDLAPAWSEPKSLLNKLKDKLDLIEEM